MHSQSERWILLIPALLLGSFLYAQAHQSWTRYWLRIDSQSGIAVVTKELWSGHGVVGYKYVVGQKEYAGKSQRNWEDANEVQVGEEAVVFYSLSHPWLSLLYKPRVVIEGLPALIIALLIEWFLLMTVINPKNKWAMDLSKKEENVAD